MNYGWEFAKIAVQLAGAVLVARLAVTWALKRYKTEKAWDREMEALANVVQALSEMDRVIFKWMQEYARETEFSDQYSEELETRYREARRKFETTAAAAAILLPKEINEALDNLDRQLNQGGFTDQWDRFTSDSTKIQEALETTIRFGKAHLRGG